MMIPEDADDEDTRAEIFEEAETCGTVEKVGGDLFGWNKVANHCAARTVHQTGVGEGEVGSFILRHGKELHLPPTNSALSPARGGIFPLRRWSVL